MAISLSDTDGNTSSAAIVGAEQLGDVVDPLHVRMFNVRNLRDPGDASKFCALRK